MFKHLEHKQSLNSNKITNSNVRNNTISTTPPKYSVFDKSFQQGTTFNSGQLIPILLQEVYPGDIYEVSANLLIRMSALISTPFMNVNLDINYFFVPYSFIDPNWEEVIGSVSNLATNGSQMLDINNLVDIPRLDLKYLNAYSNSTLAISFQYTENDLANYFNIPIKTKYVDNSNSIQTGTLGTLYNDPNTSFGFNIYPFLAYGKVWNDWYRNENYSGEVDITSVLSPDIERNGGKYITEKLKNDPLFSDFNWDSNTSSGSYDNISMNDYRLKKMNCLGFGLLPTTNFRDYFTSCLPYQQKVVDYNLNIGTVSNLTTNSLIFDPNKGYRLLEAYTINNNYGNNIVGSEHNKFAYGSNVSNAPQSRMLKTSGSVDGTTYVELGDTPPTTNNYNAFATNIPNKVNFDITPNIEFDLNEFRNSLVIQHLFETFAICGSRYVEQLNSIWGVEIDPKEIKRSEFLGGKNFNLIFNNTQQTSSNVNINNSNYQLLGSSITSSLYNSVTHEKIKLHASQHGLLLGVLTARTNINYGGQGLPKMFLYKNFLDFYNPKFNGISDQPVESLELIFSTDNTNGNYGTLNQYLLRQKTNGVNGRIYGYNEPFLHLKNNINNANGFLSINSSASLFSQFLFGKQYRPNNMNILTVFDNSQNYLYDPNIIQNTIFQVNNGNNQFYHQFISLITFDIKYISKQPLYSHPGVKYI